MKNLLITGVRGLTGKATADLFVAKSWNVIGIDNNSRAHFFGTEKQESDEAYPIYNVDIRSLVEMEEIFEYHKFDAVIHTAAQPSHDYATDHVLEDFDVNARATVILLEMTRKYCPTATFVHVSTDKVYGENMQDTLIEKETRFEPMSWLGGFNEELDLDFAGDRSFFGCSKAAGDIYAQQYAERGMTVGIFRPGCITGKNHQGAEQHGFLAYLAKCIKEGKTYTIFGYKGKQVRDQIHADDVASAFWHFVENPKSGGVYNLGGGFERSVSVLEAGEMFSKEIGKPFKYELAEARKGDRAWDVHDISNFKTDYPDWDYKYSLKHIIKDLCE